MVVIDAASETQPRSMAVIGITIKTETARCHLTILATVVGVVIRTVDGATDATISHLHAVVSMATSLIVGGVILHRRGHVTRQIGIDGVGLARAAPSSRHEDRHLPDLTTPTTTRIEMTTTLEKVGNTTTERRIIPNAQKMKSLQMVANVTTITRVEVTSSHVRVRLVQQQRRRAEGQRKNDQVRVTVPDHPTPQSHRTTKMSLEVAVTPQSHRTTKMSLEVAVGEEIAHLRSNLHHPEVLEVVVMVTVVGTITLLKTAVTVTGKTLARRIKGNDQGAQQPHTVVIKMTGVTEVMPIPNHLRRKDQAMMKEINKLLRTTQNRVEALLAPQSNSNHFNRSSHHHQHSFRSRRKEALLSNRRKVLRKRKVIHLHARGGTTPAMKALVVDKEVRKVVVAKVPVETREIAAVGVTGSEARVLGTEVVGQVINQVLLLLLPLTAKTRSIL